MTLFADTPTLGLLIGLPIGLFITAVGVLALITGVWQECKEAAGGWLMVAFGGLVVALIAGGVTAIAMWPWKHDYHHWVEKTGTVEAVSKRLVPAGDSGMQEKIVVTLNGQPYGITDTRAALLKVGDPVSIACKRAYEWGSKAHGWDCRWNGS